MPEHYYSKLDSIHFNHTETAFYTPNYITAAAVYNIYYLNNFNPGNWFENFENEYHSAKTNFKGYLRNKLMSQLILDYKDKEHDKFDSLYHSFLADCTDSLLKNSVLKQVTSYWASKKGKDQKKLSQIMPSSFVQDKEGRRLSLSELFNNKKYIVIDCWASWCKPCIEQKPYLFDIEEKFKDSVVFIYLSFDKDIQKWKKFITSSKEDDANHFLLQNDFESDFAQYFKVASIPRYIFLQKDGTEIVSFAMPLPFLNEPFERLITDAINK